MVEVPASEHLDADSDPALRGSLARNPAAIEPGSAKSMTISFRRSAGVFSLCVQNIRRSGSWSAAGQVAGRDLAGQALASTGPGLRSGSEHQGATERGQPARDHALAG